jgi:hypothetical protein
MHGPTCIFWASLTPFSLQYVSGASVPAYWLASYTWDFGIFLLPFGAAEAFFYYYEVTLN